MSRTFSMNNGSCESLKVSVRCGWSPKARQMRLTVLWTQATGLGHVSATPVGRRLGCRLQCQREDPLHVGITGPSRGAGARLIQHPVQSPLDKPVSPASHGLSGGAEGGRHGGVGLAVGAGEHQARTPCQGLGRLGSAKPLFEGLAFRGSQYQCRFRASGSHRCPPVRGGS